MWSASFGLLLFKHLELKPNLTVIDIGSCIGFHLMELAERLGKSCKLIGLDTWANAIESVSQFFTQSGFEEGMNFPESFEMKFVD